MRAGSQGEGFVNIRFAALSFCLFVPMSAFARPQSAYVRVEGPGPAATATRHGVNATLVVTQTPHARVEIRDGENREDVVVVALAGGAPIATRPGRTTGGLDNSFECDWPEADLAL